ncbi:MAG: PEP-CTERM sorting domain-containing protein [Planctomycetota bacterium]
MSKTTFVTAWLATFAAGTAAVADVLPSFAYEGFDYTPGTAVDESNGGAGFVGPWFNAVGSEGVVVEGSLAEPTGTLLTNGNAGAEIDEGRLNRQLQFALPDLVAPEGPAPAGDLYISFLMQTTNDQAYYGFELFDGGNNDSNRVLQVANEGGEFQLRLKNDPLSSVALPTSGTETHLYVLRFELINNDAVVSAYVDPDPAAPENVSDAFIASTDFLSFDRVEFAIFQGGTGDSQLLVDEIRIGSTYASVLPLIPEPGTLGLLGAAGLGLFRRRHA